MNKHKLVISCPIDCYSGYSARSRDLVKALIKLDKYDIQILSQRWGNTRFGYLRDHNEFEILSLITNTLTEKPDIWIQVTVPNEFQAVGTLNIGITAGIETTLADYTWVQGCNRMDVIFASSNHAKDVLEKTTYTNKSAAETTVVKVTKPIEVLIEGISLAKYYEVRETPPLIDLSSIPESFNFLTVGPWMQGDLGHDRKNIGFLIKAFLETFKNQKDAPGLILKTHMQSASIGDQELLKKRINLIRDSVKGSLPNIYVIHGDITDAEMNSIYNNPKVKALISLTKGEGYGRPLLEFSLVKKPIIASGWSGHLDFLDKDFTSLVPGTFEPVHESAVVEGVILKEAHWFKPDSGQVGHIMKDVKKKYKNYVAKAKKQSYKSRTEFSFDVMVEQLEELMEKYSKDIPVRTEFVMPKLQLPKLKKIE